MMRLNTVKLYVMTWLPIFLEKSRSLSRVRSCSVFLQL